LHIFVHHRLHGRCKKTTDKPTFSDAVVSLHQQLAARGDMSGRLRDMQCHLDESGTEALLYANWSADDPVFARFVLPTPTTEDAFDPEVYLRLCEHD
jgi:hypothetical protein